MHKNGRNPELKKEFLEKLDNLEKEFGVTTLSVFSKRYVDKQL